MKALSFLILLISLFATACSKATQVSGEVFIVTAGAGNYKLGLVKVSAIPEKDVASFLEHRIEADRSAEAAMLSTAEAGLADAKERLKLAESRAKPMKPGTNLNEMEESHLTLQELDNAKQAVLFAEYRVSDAKRKSDTPPGPESFFSSLPPGVSSATTDSDGKYSLDIPTAGKYLITARATRTTVGTDENYYWTVWVTADGKPRQLTLSNDNLAHSIDSIKR